MDTKKLVGGNYMLEIRMTKMLLVMTEEELLKCLYRMPSILERALKRGKGIGRALKEEERKPAKGSV